MSGIFEPTGGVALRAGPQSQAIRLPPGSVIAVHNLGERVAYIRLAAGVVIAEPAGGTCIPAGGQIVLNVGAATFLAAVAPGGPTALHVSSGT